MVILITGASRGLGAVLAESFAAAGHRVFAGVRTLPETSSAQVTYVQLDVCQDKSIEAVVAAVMQQAGRVDVLINNAGLGAAVPLEEMSLEQARAIFDTNVWGAVAMMQALLPIMRAQGSGKIINVSSIAAEIALPYRALYSASKAALSSFSQALRLEVAAQGIQVSEIQPGDFRTEIFDRAQRLPDTENACYREDYQSCMATTAAEMRDAPDPQVVASQILAIVSKPRPKAVYRVGHLLQKAAPRLKAFLPSAVFERLLLRNLKGE
jgi:NAD(P)-dependent dehydrogenase (short-subunit alcohol dehydrogenase family)